MNADFQSVIRERRSIRRFSQKAVSKELVASVLELAAFAPSAGNVQPWRVVAFSPSKTQDLFERYEVLGWESALPKIKGLMRERRGLNSSDANKAVLAFLENDLRIKGNASLLFIYSERESLGEYARYAREALSIYWHRMRNAPATKAWRFRARLSAHLFRRAFGDFFISRAATQASLANFSYGLCLAAEHYGLKSCIQFLYNGLYPQLRTQMGLSKRHELFGAVVIGHEDKEADTTSRMEEFQVRKRVPLTWVE